MESLGGVKHLEKLIPTHYELLEANQLNTPLGNFVYFMLWMFMGSGMLHDPHYQWLQKQFYHEELNKNKKSSAFYKILMKRLKKEKRTLERKLQKGDSSFYARNLSLILSNNELDEEALEIINELKEEI